MPGRISTRNSTASRLSRKSSVLTINSRSSTASRVSAPTAVPDEGPSTDLRVKICAIFADAQKSATGHRKLVVSLRKIHEACCYEPQGKNKSLNEFNEDDFNTEVARCVIRVLPVKKTEGVGDRVIKFFGQFLQHASEKDASLLAQEEVDEDEGFPETPSARLSSHLFSILLPLLTAKEKAVRYRATQIVSYMVNCLDSLDDEYYHLVRASLSKRMKDKEAMVRVQAALGLGRLAGNDGVENEENEDSDDDDAAGLLEKLLNSLQNDQSADVRKSLLLNLPLTPATLPYLLERARDLDAATRRALYSKLLPALGDFRHLSLSMREKLLRWGLRDRDEHVRKATARLFRERWIEDCAGLRDAEGNRPAELPPPSIDALLELLERIDVVNSGIESGIALQAMKEFWDGRPDYRETVSFEDPFWDNLTSESVFLARSLNDFCRDEGNARLESLIEEKMPEVTKLAFILQRYLNSLIEKVRALNNQNDGDAEEDTVEQEFVVEQLLQIAYTLDYSDEVGRRKMFSLLRETLAIPELPEEITKLVIEVLRLVCGPDSAGEREFCGIVLEAVAEVHDTISSDISTNGDADESFHSAKSDLSDSTVTGSTSEKKLLSENPEQDEAKAIKEIVVNMKCLYIAQCMLQNVGGNLKENVHLVTMLNNLVVPAVRSHEAPIRERGLVCLGLCCLLDKTLAEENLTLFVHCFSKGHAALQVTSIHILSDILSTHPTLLTTSSDPPSSPSTTSNPTTTPSPLQKQLTKVFTKALKSTQSPEVQAAATVALSKHLLTRTLKDADLLRALLLTFFDPASRDNAAARQALSYFLPVFAHSRRENMALLAAVVPAVMRALVVLEEEREADEEDFVGAAAVGGMLVDWTDARKLVVLEDASGAAAGAGQGVWDEAGRRDKERGVNGDVHLDLATGVLERVLSGSACPKEERKALLGMLGKLFVTANSDVEKLRAVRGLVAEASEAKVAADTAGRNALAKLGAAVEKALAALEGGDGSGNGSGRAKAGGRGRKIRAPDAEAAEVKAGATERGETEERRVDGAVKGSSPAESPEETIVKEEQEVEAGETSVVADESRITLDQSQLDDDGDTIMEM